MSLHLPSNLLLAEFEQDPEVLSCVDPVTSSVANSLADTGFSLMYPGPEMETESLSF